MTDPRINKLAQVLVHYSLGLQAGQQVQIRSHPIAEELTQAVYEQVIKAGAFPFVQVTVPGLDEIFYKYASDAQLEYISPIRKLVTRLLTPA
jgi:aminopeptidase